MLIEEKIKGLKEKIEILEKLDPNAVFDEDIFIPKFAYCVLPDLEETCRILESKLTKVSIQICPQTAFVEGVTSNINLEFGDDVDIWLIDLTDVKTFWNEEKFNKIRDFYLADIDDPYNSWLDSIFYGSMPSEVEDDFYAAIRRSKMSANFILSLFTLKNREFLRNNNVKLSFGCLYENSNIDELISLAEQDKIIETNVDSDT